MNSQSTMSGGSIMITNGNLTVNTTTFMFNSALSGGAIALLCSKCKL